ETLVLDWGLAKIVGQAEPSMGHTEPALQPESVTVLETTAGTVLGTPAFMSPEQAAGRLDQLGPASDIWRPGATLFSALARAGPRRGDRPRRGASAGPPGRRAAARPAWQGRAGSAGRHLSQGDGGEPEGPLHDRPGASGRRRALAGGRAGRRLA